MSKENKKGTEVMLCYIQDFRKDFQKNFQNYFLNLKVPSSQASRLPRSKALNPMSDGGGGGLIAPSPDNMGSFAIGNDLFDNFF